jgi:hypothetical protein
MMVFLRIWKSILLALIGIGGFAFSSDIVLVDFPGPLPSSRDVIEQACQFYGLKLRIVTDYGELERLSSESLRIADLPEAVLATAFSMADIRVREVLKSLREETNAPMPLLIINIDSTTGGSLLQEISAGAIISCTKLDGALQNHSYNVVGSETVAKQLSNQNYKVAPEAADILEYSPGHPVNDIIRLSLKDSDRGKPIFSSLTIEGRDVFFYTRFLAVNSPDIIRPGLERGRLFEALPILMFLRYVSDERCWHYPGYFANLTIDDPWLTEPYGHLRFGSLVEEMRKEKFHTTIAFISWNYDRSESAVISLFRENADLFSLCIHGDNHDHREFYKGQTLREQESDILQGLARMEAFRQLTGIAYDRVMVFPHSIAPLESLGILKKNNFLATVNSVNIPEGELRPQGLFANLRTATLDFANFLSISRTQKLTESNVALELFLGNPILLYSHHDLFKKGNSAFKAQADTINKLEPSVQWKSLGEIARNLYLMRRRTDGNIDIRAFCRNIELHNMQSNEKIYHVLKPDSFSYPISRVTVDGSEYPYEKTPEGITIVLEIPARTQRNINIEYESDSDLMSIDVRKNNQRVNRLRKISDFRDIKLSSSAVGRLLISFYYNAGVYQLGMKKLILLGFGILIVILLVAWRLFLWLRRKRREREIS